MKNTLGSILLAMVIQIAISKWVSASIADWHWWIGVLPVSMVIYFTIKELLDDPTK